MRTLFFVGCDDDASISFNCINNELKNMIEAIHLNKKIFFACHLSDSRSSHSFNKQALRRHRNFVI